MVSRGAANPRESRSSAIFTTRATCSRWRRPIRTPPDSTENIRQPSEVENYSSAVEVISFAGDLTTPPRGRTWITAHSEGSDFLRDELSGNSLTAVQLTSASQILMPETAHKMIVHHAGGLHERVANC